MNFKHIEGGSKVKILLNLPTNRNKKSSNIGEVGVKGEEVKYRGKMPTSFMDGPIAFKGGKCMGGV